MTREPSFNVLHEPWIPVVRPDRGREELGILATLARAQDLLAIRHPSPIVEFGLHRLLVAFVFDAMDSAGKPIRTPGRLRQLFESGKFNTELLDRYCQSWSDRFDLFDGHHPFLQTNAAAGGDKPLAALYPAVPSGTNVQLWHHYPEGAMAADAASAAQLLTTIAPFMTAGGSGLSPSINGAPAIYALPTGRNLLQTLVLNFPIRARGEGNGTVAWRDDRIPGGERHQATMGEALTWRPRRVKLLPTEDGNGRLARICFEAGDSTRLNWTDPNLAYKYDGDDQTPVRMREGRPLWRDAGPLALLNRASYTSQDGKIEYRRPDVIEQAFDLVEGDLRILAYGMRTDMKMKVFEWSVAEMTIPAALGRSTRLGAWIQSEQDRADRAAWTVRNAIRTLYPRRGEGNKKALGRAIERAERAFWRALEREFFELTSRAALASEADLDVEGGMDSVQEPWRSVIRDNAASVFESVAEDFDADADALERAVTARRRLLGSLRKILS